MTMGQFPTLSAAIDHAKRMGGWIARCFDGTTYWFDAAVWTMTPIMKHACLSHNGADIGTWRDFEEGQFA